MKASRRPIEAVKELQEELNADNDCDAKAIDELRREVAELKRNGRTQ